MAQSETHVLLFGSQTLSATGDSFTELRETLLGNDAFHWILDAVRELSSHWVLVASVFYDLDVALGGKQLGRLNDWLETGKFGQTATTLPNILVTPLVVSGHLVQYLQFLEGKQPESVFANVHGEALGLCTGLLSAFAVASSSSHAHLRRYGAVIIRLAMLVGAVIDAESSCAGVDQEATSISAAWASIEAEEAMRTILDQFPEAYISVLFDSKRATITTSQKTVAALTQQLKSAHVVTAEIGLRGRFHCKSHIDSVPQYISFCDANPAFQLPDASRLVFPTRSNTDGEYISHGNLHAIAIRSILVDQPNWHRTVSSMLSSSFSNLGSRIISFGSERSVPFSLLRSVGSRIHHFADLKSLLQCPMPPGQPEPEDSYKRLKDVPDNRIAVIGMSCNVPGASDLEEFWDLLCQGKSQHVEVPPERFGFKTSWREVDPERKWYGNFIQDYDAFDHKFFKRSPREMASTDPQQRVMLQIVYQAVEQSGYFSSTTRKRSLDRDARIGCYVGAGLVDYENNISCYPANAYSATGNLKSFAAGKISHYFGWTGPSMTIDTACSSSAVAIHHACRSILTGDCSAAVAGGVNIMSSPEWFQNLAGASFLSPTGPCKPFDVKADGYCRGEGAAAVFLKKYSDAAADGDQILGIIGATAVYQNRNCTAITVPDSSSLSDMFRHVTYQAGLESRQISVVEAHGTGTPVGDPAEYEGIRRVFGGSVRHDVLSLGSVKGLIGHAESASGIVSLIKILLMIHHGVIPPQASFDAINPAIKASPQDQIQITTTPTPWKADYRAALINNYGASGSNASIVMTQPPSIKQRPLSHGVTHTLNVKHPFWLSGFDDRSLAEYCAKLLKFIQSHNSNRAKSLSLADLAFQVSRQSKLPLARSFIFDCSSMDELEHRLATFPKEQTKSTITTTTSSLHTTRPVILCFGGQVSTFVGLDRHVYESVTLLRRHLNECDVLSQQIGVPGGIYPEIFQKEPIGDIVKLQTILFATQYSCAKSWIDCGVPVSAVVGHSFGELTALCVSGIVSLQDAIRMIIGRAELIKHCWGEDKGSMMAVEAELSTVEELLAAVNASFSGHEFHATIACYNGPRSFTLAGSSKAIDMVEKVRAERSKFSSTKAKTLRVTNAFHSALAEPLTPKLKEIGQGISFADPLIPFEQATQSRHTGRLTPEYVADHMRQPVWFNNAVQRLSQEYPESIWLEAGSNSTVTIMASRALSSSRASHFQPINITSDNAFRHLTDATLNLWKEGINISFWPHHPIQTSDYSPLLLPPYQFEKSRHWLELKEPPKPDPTSITQVLSQSEISKRLWTFVGFQDQNERSARFDIKTNSERFEEYVSGHRIAQTVPLCPSILQTSIVVDAVTSLYPGLGKSQVQPQLENMDSHSPMTINPSRAVWLNAEALDQDRMVWDWKIVSQSIDEKSSITPHISGRLLLRLANDAQFQTEFSRYERLVGYTRHEKLINRDAEIDEAIQGRNVYRSFAEIVEYGAEYRGVKKIVGRGNESAGRVLLPYNLENWLNVGLADSFCQIAGIFVNCMTDRSEKEMYVSDRIEQWIRSPRLTAGADRPDAWDVYACHHRPSSREFLSDIFVFDPRNCELAEVILGIRYQRVSKAALVKMLSNLAFSSSGATKPNPISASNDPEGLTVKSPLPAPGSAHPAVVAKKNSLSVDVARNLKDILVNLSGLEPSEISEDSDLIELGIDSLMAMELAREIETAFNITLDTVDLLEITEFRSLVKCIHTALGTGGQGELEVANGPVNGETEVNGPIIIDQPQNFEMEFSRANDASSPTVSNDEIPTEAIIDAFRKTKVMTDDFMAQSGLSGYVNNILPQSDELCVVHILDACEQLGCPIRNVARGERLSRIQHLPRHTQYVNCLYNILQNFGLVEIHGSQIVRTSVLPPTRSAESLLEELVQQSPSHESDHRLTYLAGVKLADCLVGKADGLQLIFSSAEGRALASSMYGKSPINIAWIEQMVRFLEDLIPRLSTGGTIKILELGAGTGGTTAKMVSLFTTLKVPVEYTVTDISSSLVAGARKRFKEYPFMKFRVHDIEKPPAADLLHSQHLVIATNCIHATHNLADSSRNIHDILHPSGALLMLEMTRTLAWIDLIFGLLEGWWLFDDGRRHALTDPTQWEETLHSVGYGRVDWTDGRYPETGIQRLIVGLASAGSRYGEQQHLQRHKTDLAARQAVVDSYIWQYTEDFVLSSDQNLLPSVQPSYEQGSSSGSCVVLTGATGSLGCQLVAYLIQLPEIKTIVCLNRHSNVEATQRQRKALESRGISLDSTALAKLKVFGTDTSKPKLGLSTPAYEGLVDQTTHIVHNAWPMSITRTLNAFEAQFKVMRNLIHFARDIACRRTGPPRESAHQRITFQFISSIATVGHYPLWTGCAVVPEEPMTVDSVLPSGYGDAKLVCELMLEETLSKHPSLFRATAVRIGQIAGSKTSGYWNPVEHLSFLIKSSQTIQALPALRGDLSWCPATDVAATLGELLVAHKTPYKIYHIENPSRQPWAQMIQLLSQSLCIPPQNIIPHDEWVSRVKRHPLSLENENPARMIIDFLDAHFVRMSCGGLILGTAHTREHSKTLAEEDPVSPELVQKYIQAWRDMGFLK